MWILVRKRLSCVRIWQLLILVAVVAVAIGSIEAKRRAEENRSRAELVEWYQIRAALCRYSQMLYETGGDVTCCRCSDPPKHYDRNPTKAAYYARLRLKYERAARYPWLEVSPDEQEPD